jgi:hypothetical protein
MRQDTSTHLEPGRRSEETPVGDRNVSPEENNDYHSQCVARRRQTPAQYWSLRPGASILAMINQLSFSEVLCKLRHRDGSVEFVLLP